MDDIRKLENIIDALEGQAKQVSEYSGLLSAVNDARTQIEESAAILESSAESTKTFVSENRGHLVQLSDNLATLEHNHKQASDESREHLIRLNGGLSALEAAHNAFSLDARRHIDELKAHLDTISGDHTKFVADSKKAFERLENALFSFDTSIKGIERGSRHILESISALDFATPKMLSDGFALSQKASQKKFEAIEASVDQLSKKLENSSKTTMAFLVLLTGLQVALAAYLFTR